MKIVVTDGGTLNPGDLQWDDLQGFGELTVYERTAVKDIYKVCKDADIIITNKVPFSRELIYKLDGLKLISVTATGYNVIDIDAAKEKGVAVYNVPAYGTYSVAQHVFALLLELTNQVGRNGASVSAGEWEKSPDWSYTKGTLKELHHKIMGIVGLGNIGRQTAEIARAFGMRVIYCNASGRDENGLERTDLETLFSASDVISLHCPLTPETNGFINKKVLRLMKPSSFLINTARGQLINELDLADALRNNQIAAAAVDVLSVEPPSSDNPLLRARNCLITPHTAWITVEARQRLMKETCRNVERFLQGNIENRVA
jgi:glycerate dehydrogenase